MTLKSKLKFVDLLQGEQIDTKDIDRLKDAGIFTLKSLQRATQKQLTTALKGFSVEKIKLVKNAANKLCGNCDILAGDEIADESFVISTGVKTIDDLLNGGIKSMQITEAFGVCSDVITLLSRTLCVSSQLTTNDNFAEGKAVFIDTKQSYDTLFIEAIARRMQVDNPSRAILNVSHYEVREKEALDELLDTFPKHFYDAKGAYNIIVINSLSELFPNKSKHKKLKEQILLKLQALSENYNCAVLLANKVMDESTSIKPMVRFTVKEFGSHFMIQVCNELLTFESDAQFTVSHSFLSDLPRK